MMPVVQAEQDDRHPVDTSASFTRPALIGGALILAAGVAAWAVMGETLFYVMSTGLGWLCM